jgi:hypothetical protein
MVAPDRARGLSGTIHDRASQQPSRVYTAATSWLTLAHASARAAAAADVNWRAADSIMSYPQSGECDEGPQRGPTTRGKGLKALHTPCCRC